MQDVIILDRIESSDPGALALLARDYRGRPVMFQAGAEQCINLNTVRHQQCPCVVLVDGLIEGFGGFSVPADALVSVMPMAAKEVQAVLDAGAAERLMAFARGVD